ncbi:transposase [Pseudomaricurvus hydrocarbonicus]|uniref:transposase n=1 Tax=Pseudomaricurvus hydrocarbonicus TaxID=1470433 RepID=UPI00312CBF5B
MKDILIACVDELKDFPDVISAVYPQAQIQLCIIPHGTQLDEVCAVEGLQVRDSDLKRIYQSAAEEEALQALDEFAGRWNEKSPHISCF